MRKILSCILAIFLIASFPITAFANGIDSQLVSISENGSIEYFDDGSYAITAMEESLISTFATTKTGSKTTDYYNSNDVKQWTVKLTATFSYTGSSATCTGASTSYTIYNSNWKVTSAAASKSGNKATGKFTVKYYLLGVVTNTQTPTITITCNNSGTLS